MNDEGLFARLARSRFRSRFRLDAKDLAYLEKHGRGKIRDHAYDFIRARLAPASPAKDGKQTPFRGHPVFKAQHATATCCRGCLAKWHRIPKGTALDEARIDYVVSVILEWIGKEQQSCTP